MFLNILKNVLLCETKFNVITKEPIYFVNSLAFEPGYMSALNASAQVTRSHTCTGYREVLIEERAVPIARPFFSVSGEVCHAAGQENLCIEVCQALYPAPWEQQPGRDLAPSGPHIVLGEQTIDGLSFGEALSIAELRSCVLASLLRFDLRDQPVVTVPESRVLDLSSPKAA